MICFRDMAFCATACGNHDCPRNFTADQERAAQEWWSGRSGGIPVQFADYAADCTRWVPAARQTGSDRRGGGAGRAGVRMAGFDSPALHQPEATSS